LASTKYKKDDLPFLGGFAAFEAAVLVFNVDVLFVG